MRIKKQYTARRNLKVTLAGTILGVFLILLVTHRDKRKVSHRYSTDEIPADIYLPQDYEVDIEKGEPFMRSQVAKATPSSQEGNFPLIEVTTEADEEDEVSQRREAKSHSSELTTRQIIQSSTTTTPPSTTSRPAPLRPRDRSEEEEEEGYNNAQTSANIGEPTLLEVYMRSQCPLADNLEGKGMKPKESLPLYTEHDVAALPRHPKGKRFPHCLIVGVRKGGTGALRDFLALHPHIEAPDFEPGFFFREGTYLGGLEAYREMLPAVAPNQISIEKSAEYFHTASVPERVHALNSSMKIMLIVRDPFIRMVSDYLFMRRYRLKQDAIEKYYSLEDLLVNRTSGQLFTQWGCLKRSVYYLYIQEWFKYFPKEQIHIIDGDDFRENNPGRELQKVEQFLGVHPLLTESRFYFNETKGFYCVKNYDDGGCLNVGKGHEHPTINPFIEKKVRRFFKKYNRMFYKIVGKDFGWL